jgi:hypothetical protein
MSDPTVFMEAHGKQGRLVEMRKSDIKVPEYQREVDWPRIKRCAREFDWFLFGVLYASYRSPDYYVVDGRHRLEMARLLDEVDMVPCMGFDFHGPEHEAEIFVKLQRYRKPLVTKDMHGAELYAGGEFGRIARVAQEFVDGLHCETVPLASIRKLARVKPEALERVKPLLDPLVGPAPLHKDFIEALVYLEGSLEPGESLATRHRGRLLDMGYNRLVAGMLEYQRRHQSDRISKVASPRMKADALRWALCEDGYTLVPVGELGARVVPAAAD